jgi:hypothetical protein
VEDTFLVTQIPIHLRPIITSLLMTGAALEWYNNQYRPTAAGKTQEDLKAAVLAHFSSRSEDEMARRKQRLLRPLPLSPLNMVASVNMFNTAFTNNQVYIRPQATRDTYLAYVDCIRASAESYPDALQLLQGLTASFSAVAQADQTLDRVQNITAAVAPNVVDGASGSARTHHPRSAPAIPAGNLHTMVVAPPQRIAGVRRGRNERGEPTICNYCHKGDTHQSARAKTDTGYDGDILCPQLKEDIAAGRTSERIPGRKYPKTGQRSALNHYGSRQNGTDPTADNITY